MRACACAPQSPQEAILLTQSPVLPRLGGAPERSADTLPLQDGSGRDPLWVALHAVSRRCPPQPPLGGSLPGPLLGRRKVTCPVRGWLSPCECPQDFEEEPPPPGARAAARCCLRSAEAHAWWCPPTPCALRICVKGGLWAPTTPHGRCQRARPSWGGLSSQVPGGRLQGGKQDAEGVSRD